ncbi:unnamed protein product, partial [Phaeothamnion confervicola]
MVDGWTDAQGKSVVAVLAVTAERKTYLLELLDCSADSHTAAFNTDLFSKMIDKVGVKKVAAICTDGASAMTKGRSDLVKIPKYRHIIDLRCQMHGFNLV